MATIALVHPDPGGASGNLVTALRWERVLGELGHRCRRSTAWEGDDADLLVALHARKGHAAVAAFRAAHPGRPLVVAAAGTDLYGEHADAPETRTSFEAADRIVVLQRLAVDELPEAQRGKAVVIHQSLPARPRAAPNAEHFEVCVLANVRPIKDALRAAAAARRLPASSRVRVLHLGQVLDEGARQEVERERAENPRYVWLGELSHEEALGVLARCRALVTSSRGEGGANVVTEALACGTPILASDIPGARGILGDDWPAYFPVGDTEALAALLTRLETDEAFRGRLEAATLDRAELVHPDREREAWAALLADLLR